ncbi:hypothetical protein SAMN05877753_108129 [Bacillus oleivorans]|uniref:Amphi-Trp domain-containing protein n=1 Tax=Bacillus oleivorans TaxID=1448271 RepID=A0A285D2P3_9BACI|nr:hypothetical protein [Bacillus oleivorans]SNX74052.1 hypothetical protein SAMN05877753_108129 [Bacillus oleivorans]
MKLEEEFVGRKEQYVELLKRVISELESDTLNVRGKKIELPDEDMEYKLAHKSEFGANKLTIGIEWIDESEIDQELEDLDLEI